MRVKPSTGFTDTITAYVNVIQDQQLVALNQSNEALLTKELQATNDRFRVGELTRTDVAQAEAALASASATRQTAEGTLQTARAVYEQLVGELEDEFDIAPAPPAVTDANAPLALDGAVNIRDLEAQYELKLPQDEGFETLAGFVLSRLQKIPREEDTFEYEGRRFVVEKMEGNRIATVKIEPVRAAAKQLAGD